ncbi:MAG TPA: pyridoxamine 5'-phosphate oxidase family protein [Candidatus Limnocylindrales bacterium]
MSSWEEFASEVPAFAAFVRERLEAHRHRTMATIRADGSPRISGIEITISRGELWIGGLADSRKFDDLRRDPRMALHSGPDDPPGFRGDARLAGRAVLVPEETLKAAFLDDAGGGPPGPFELFRLDITEASTVREAESKDHLVIESWKPSQPVRRTERY